jgi:hypothetical protein
MGSQFTHVRQGILQIPEVFSVSGSGVFLQVSVSINIPASIPHPLTVCPN